MLFIDVVNFFIENTPASPTYSISSVKALIPFFFVRLSKPEK